MTTIIASLDPDLIDDYSWMNADDAAQMRAVQQAAAGIMATDPQAATEDAGSVLGRAAAAAGINLGQSALEGCAYCGCIYNSEYGGEYIDSAYHEDLDEELGRVLPDALHEQHYCGLQCLRSHLEELGLEPGVYAARVVDGVIVLDVGAGPAS